MNPEDNLLHFLTGEMDWQLQSSDDTVGQRRAFHTYTYTYVKTMKDIKIHLSW